MAFPLLPVLFGAANFGLGAFGSISSANQQNAAARLQNKQAIEAYKRQQRIYGNENANAVTLFNTRQQRYGLQQIANQNAASNAYFAEQAKLDELFKGMKFKQQSLLTEQLVARGKVGASEQSGRTAARRALAIESSFGRNQAVMDEQARSAIQGATYRNKRTREALMIANENAFYNVGQAPTFGEQPLAPAMRQGADPFATALGIGTSLIKGVQSGMGFAQQINNLGFD